MVIDRSIIDVQPIHRLGSTLEELHVETDPRAYGDHRSRLNLALFPRLRRLSTDWGQVRHTIVHSCSAHELELRRYGEHDLTSLAACTSLTQLTLIHYPQVRSLAGLAGLPGLASLGVFLATKLTDISQLAACQESVLRRLELESCSGYSRLDAIGGLTALEHLNLSECRDLESVAPLRSLLRLRTLWMWGSTRILDNDLGPLLDLCCLCDLRMKSRRTYRPSVAEVRKRLGLQA
jgi:internalin A